MEGVFGLVLDLVVLDVRTFGEDHLGDGVGAVAVTSSSGVGFYDRHLALRFGEDHRARAREERGPVGGREEDEFYGLFDDGAGRELDEGPVLGEGGVQRGECVAVPSAESRPERPQRSSPLCDDRARLVTTTPGGSAVSRP